MEIHFPPLAPCSSSSCNSASPKTLPSSLSEASRCDHGGERTEREGDEEVTSPAIIPHRVNGRFTSATATIEAEPDPTVGFRSSCPADGGKAAIGKGKRPQRASSSSSSSMWQRRPRVAVGRRSSPGLRGRSGGSSLQGLALPLGMSIAAVISEVLDRNDVATSRIPADHLSMICASAVREAIESVFGDRFDTFMRNFENSFGSTLKTLRLLKDASLDEQQNSLCTSYAREDISEQPPAPCADELPAVLDNIHEEMQSSPTDHQLIVHGQISQELADVSKRSFGSGCSRSVLNTFRKSVREQSRSNDLKEFEIALVMKKLQMKESQLALTSDANLLERFKITMGITKAAFKEEKLKNQLHDTRHAELVKKCIDCLVSGLLIMSTCLFYGTYIYSYKRISEATISCTSPPKGSKSWWLPNPMASFSSGLHTLRCHVTVASRMLFGLLMILALAYSLLQRSATSRQTMPVTFILLLLGIACGYAGKICVDTLGASGYIWVLFWEAFCFLHFVANVFTSALFYVLHGPVSVSGNAGRVRFPYWIRRVVFYSIALLFLPILCGLMPFASLHEWKEHFFSLAADKLFDPISGDGS